MSSYQPGNTEGRTEEQVHVQPTVRVHSGAPESRAGNWNMRSQGTFHRGQSDFYFRKIRLQVGRKSYGEGQTVVKETKVQIGEIPKQKC